ncbi:S41 family peptidase [Neolewinella agarilytica]|uniref:Tricorn protease C1 domain-containing protein n=1 Tax=Neolewinella agarilytica TaxID=478744 RepID=A0A1H9AEP0_9BACT|nr:S41 family peptidase [Neolewinella agarilytica]SEP75196.1 Tricorn protease C1 domain-containing protein [Neolewinella agarilytica]
MNRLLLPSLFLLLLFFTGCQRLILGEDEANDPENNFEIFWKDFDRHYGLFTVRGWDWDSIYAEFRPQVTAQTTDEELFEVYRQMVEYLDDSHTFVYWPGRDFFSGNSEDDERTEAEFSLPLILDQHLEVIDSSSEEGYVYGQLRGRNVGYLYLAGIEMEDLSFGDKLLTDLGQNDALIIDLRNNSGGDDGVGAALAGRFADRTELIYTVQERNGPEHDDFAGKTEYYLRPQGTVQYDKPVIVLTDNITVSAAEVMLIYLNALPQVTQIGTATSGDFSDTGMRRFLPNGMQYQYSIMKFLLPDGTSLDGVGHVPDIEIRNSAADIDAGNDLVLERAFRFLLEEYGIE